MEAEERRMMDLGILGLLEAIWVAMAPPRE